MQHKSKNNSKIILMINIVVLLLVDQIYWYANKRIVIKDKII